MIPGQASRTAQAVAAHRLGFDRVPGPPDGYPEADQRLTAAVADGIEVDRGSRMGRYLRARTAFFDRLVVDALAQGFTQVVDLGAGYDGRALRYRHAGVRWFEVDHPDTQLDKRRALDELAIDVGGIGFVAIDLSIPAELADLADRLTATGHQGSVETLVLWEGVVNYLEVDAVTATLDHLRRALATGSRLGVSVATSGDDDRHDDFARAVSRLGEEATRRIPPDLAAELLEAAGWRVVEPQPPTPADELFRRLGFLVADARP